MNEWLDHRPEDEGDLSQERNWIVAHVGHLYIS